MANDTKPSGAPPMDAETRAAADRRLERTFDDRHAQLGEMEDVGKPSPAPRRTLAERTREAAERAASIEQPPAGLPATDALAAPVSLTAAAHAQALSSDLRSGGLPTLQERINDEGYQAQLDAHKEPAKKPRPRAAGNKPPPGARGRARK